MSSETHSKSNVGASVGLVREDQLRPLAIAIIKELLSIQLYYLRLLFSDNLVHILCLDHKLGVKLVFVLSVEFFTSWLGHGL